MGKGGRGLTYGCLRGEIPLCFPTFLIFNSFFFSGLAGLRLLLELLVMQ